MKKKNLFLLTLLLVVFTTGQVFASSDEFDEAEEVEVLELEEEIEEIIEEVEEILDEQENILQEEEIIQEEIEYTLEDVESLTEIGDKIEHGIKKGREILDIVEKQYNMKRQFVHNSKNAYDLTLQAKNDLKDIGIEMKEIIKDKERTIDKETYGKIRELTGSIESAIKESEYIAGSILKESKNYVGYLRNKQFKEAANSFQKILLLQDEQVKLLTTANTNIEQIKVLLASI
ncbi:hypothetical protein [Anaerosalibacter massiliensis]|uniref:Uncharacterized protein n=1 Tax=Anaerosalibacter massiliensis TaxID=1347392 RepID=A0A9X2S5N6_9FIRM|nr:hypothetical protein [Anaerosalibacter massiliensis]MCR2044519.1 hypothetical protein [Anaerosalibacter massiliensis]